MELNRRDLLRLLASGLTGTAGTALTGCSSPRSAAAADSSSEFPLQLDFASKTDGEAWDAQWICPGVANLRIEQGEGLLEAGTDIFPNDPRPVVFARDARTLNTRITATISRTGSAVGLVLRRQSPRDYYAAILDTDLLTLSILRRSGFDLVTLASTVVLPTALPDLIPGGHMVLDMQTSGSFPTRILVTLTGADSLPVQLEATDSTEALQQAGDPGVLSQADTLLPASNMLVPALGNLHLLPYTVQEGQAVTGTPVGAQFFETIRRRSTASFVEIHVEPDEAPSPTPASVFAATTGVPLPGGATLHVASDLPAQVELEIATAADFVNAQRMDAGLTDAFQAIAQDVTNLAPAEYFWRPRLTRAGLETLGPVRRFRVLPAASDSTPVVLAYGSCGSQFNAIYDHIAARRPDVFIWQGDLNYPDAHGPFAQTMAGYAGTWRHFLDNPRLAPILERCAFVAGRDDHDYGLQDANSMNLVPWGLAPWESLMNPRTWHQFSAGLAEVWVLDQRQFKLDPTLPDTAEKTLLGMAQRQWLFDGLETSTAPFKIICSPATLAPSGVANARDGSWAAGFTAERDLLLDHIRNKVSGQTIFLSGDTHFTMLWDLDGLFEQRACPLDIPPPNDISIANPTLELTFGSTPGVVYWSRRSHFSLVTIATEASGPVMTVELVRDDGLTVHSRRFEA